MKVLVVGLGAIGQRHVRNLRALLGTSVHLLAYRALRQSPELTDHLEVVKDGDVERTYRVVAYDTLDEALAEQPALTLVCNPTALHVPVALAAARAGSHLFIEKPLSHDLHGVQHLVDLVSERRLTAAVGFQWRFHPCFERLAELLREQSIGRVIAARIQVGEYLPGWHAYEDYRTSYAARRDLGGGALLTQSHEFDAVIALFGMPRRVFAVGGHLSRLEVDVEDTASVLLECVVEGRIVPVHVQQDYLQQPASRTCEVIGDAGKILVDFRASRLERFDASGHRAEIFESAGVSRNQLFLDELRQVLACASGDARPLVTLGEGACSLRLALAARESIDRRTVIDLGSPGVGGYQ